MIKSGWLAQPSTQVERKLCGLPCDHEHRVSNAWSEPRFLDSRKAVVNVSIVGWPTQKRKKLEKEKRKRIRKRKTCTSCSTSKHLEATIATDEQATTTTKWTNGRLHKDRYTLTLLTRKKKPELWAMCSEKFGRPIYSPGLRKSRRSGSVTVSQSSACLRARRSNR